MKVILLETVPSLGDVGEVVNVKNGYARNFLFPRKLAASADERNIREFENVKKQAAARAEKVRNDSEEVKKRLEELSINLQQKAGENEKLYGAVTNADIAKALAERGFEVNRRNIQLSEPIKKLGVYNIPVKLSGGVEASVKVWVAKEESEEAEK
jgi:large subunit ribosomal protein L9